MKDMRLRLRLIRFILRRLSDKALEEVSFAAWAERTDRVGPK